MLLLEHAHPVATMKPWTALMVGHYTDKIMRDVAPPQDHPFRIPKHTIRISEYCSQQKSTNNVQIRKCAKRTDTVWRHSWAHMAWPWCTCSYTSLRSTQVISFVMTIPRWATLKMSLRRQGSSLPSSQNWSSMDGGTDLDYNFISVDYG